MSADERTALKIRDTLQIWQSCKQCSDQHQRLGESRLCAACAGNVRTRSAVADLATDATSTAAATAATAAVRSAQDSSAHAVAPAAREEASAAAERSWLPVALGPAGAAVACVRIAGHLAEIQAHAALAAGRAGDAEDDRSARGGGAGGASQPRRELSFAGNLDRLHSPTTPAAAGSVAASTGPAAPVSADAALAALAAAQGALEGAGVVGERLHGVARSAAAALPDGLAASAVERLRDAALLQILAVRTLEAVPCMPSLLRTHVTLFECLCKAYSLPSILHMIIQPCRVRTGAAAAGAGNA